MGDGDMDAFLSKMMGEFEKMGTKGGEGKVDYTHIYLELFAGPLVCWSAYLTSLKLLIGGY
jgi:hypothetical protein